MRTGSGTATGRGRSHTNHDDDDEDDNSNGRCCWLGGGQRNDDPGRERSIFIVPPPQSSLQRGGGCTSGSGGGEGIIDEEAISIILGLFGKLHDVLSRDETRRLFEEIIVEEQQQGEESLSSFRREEVDKEESVREILTDRYELFVRPGGGGGGSGDNNGGTHNSLININSKKSTAAWDALLRIHSDTLPADTGEILVEYATRQARRDPRLGGGGRSFGNFSIVCSYGSVDSQAPHIDMMLPNYQFAVMISDGCPGTILYDLDRKQKSGKRIDGGAADMRMATNTDGFGDDGDRDRGLCTAIESAEDLKKLWDNRATWETETTTMTTTATTTTSSSGEPPPHARGGDDDVVSCLLPDDEEGEWNNVVNMPEKLVEAMENNEACRALLGQYGSVLIPEHLLEACKRRRDNLPAGSVLSIPGSLLHAGPEMPRGGFRAVLFFTALPTNDDDGGRGGDDLPIPAYDLDTQFTAVNLFLELLATTVWHVIGLEEREYLLKILVRYLTFGSCSSSSSSGSKRRRPRTWVHRFVDPTGGANEPFVSLASFMHYMERQQQQRHHSNQSARSATRRRKEKSLARIVRQAAKNDSFCNAFVLGNPDFRIVSVDDLMVATGEGDDQELSMAILHYNRTTGRIVIQFPTNRDVYYRKKKQKDGSGRGYEIVLKHRDPAAPPVYWEGGLHGDMYRLRKRSKVLVLDDHDDSETTMTTTTEKEDSLHDWFDDNDGGLFDGTNGILTDTDGDLIRCYRMNDDDDSGYDHIARSPEPASKRPRN